MSVNESENEISRYIVYTISFFLLIVIVYHSYVALSIFYYWLKILGYSGEIDWGEAVVLLETNRLLSGENIYPGSEENLFTGSIYGPVYYLITALAASSKPDSYLPLRIVSIIGLVIAFSSCGFIIFKKSGSRMAIILGILLLATPTGIAIYGPVCKPDSLYLGITLLGLAIVIPNLRSNLVFLSVPLFVGALYIKLSAVPAPAAVFIAMFLSGEKRRALFFVLSMGIAFLLTGGAFTYIFGRDFLVHFFTYNVAEFPLAGVLLQFPFYLLFWIAHLLIAALVNRFTSEKIVVIYFLSAFFFHLPLSGKAGASFVYHNEVTIALFLIIAIGFGNFLKGHTAGFVSVRYAAVICLLLIIEIFYFNIVFTKYYRLRQYTPDAADVIADAEIQRTISGFSGAQRPLVFASNPGTIARHRPGFQLPIVDPFLYRQHILLGRNSGALFDSYVRERKFLYIILNSHGSDLESESILGQRLTQNQLSGIRENYRLFLSLRGTKFTDGDVRIYVPEIRTARGQTTR